MFVIPPRSTRTDPLFPYTPLCRAQTLGGAVQHLGALGEAEPDEVGRRGRAVLVEGRDRHRGDARLGDQPPAEPLVVLTRLQEAFGVDEQEVRTLAHCRSEERRVGKEGVSTCRSRWSPYH